MEDSVREEGTHSMSGSRLENRVQIAGMKTGAAQQWYAACLASLIGAACQGNSLFRDVNSDDVETEFEKVKRISPDPAIDDLETLLLAIRPDIEALVLERDESAPTQIA